MRDVFIRLHSIVTMRQQVHILNERVSCSAAEFENRSASESIWISTSIFLSDHDVIYMVNDVSNSVHCFLFARFSDATMYLKNDLSSS